MEGVRSRRRGTGSGSGLAENDNHSYRTSARTSNRRAKARFTSTANSRNSTPPVPIVLLTPGHPGILPPMSILPRHEPVARQNGVVTGRRGPRRRVGDTGSGGHPLSSVPTIYGLPDGLRTREGRGGHATPSPHTDPDTSLVTGRSPTITRSPPSGRGGPGRARLGHVGHRGGGTGRFVFRRIRNRTLRRQEGPPGQ